VLTSRRERLRTRGRFHCEAEERHTTYTYTDIRACCLNSARSAVRGCVRLRGVGAMGRRHTTACACECSMLAAVVRVCPPLPVSRRCGRCPNRHTPGVKTKHKCPASSGPRGWSGRTREVIRRRVLSARRTNKQAHGRTKAQQRTGAASHWHRPVRPCSLAAARQHPSPVGGAHYVAPSADLGFAEVHIRVRLHKLLEHILLALLIRRRQARGLLPLIIHHLLNRLPRVAIQVG